MEKTAFSATASGSDPPTVARKRTNGRVASSRAMTSAARSPASRSAIRCQRSVAAVSDSWLPESVLNREYSEARTLKETMRMLCDGRAIMVMVM